MKWYNFQIITAITAVIMVLSALTTDGPVDAVIIVLSDLTTDVPVEV